MKKNLLTSVALAACLFLASCGDSADKKKDNGDKPDMDDKKETTAKESAASIAQRWCALNGAASKAAYGPEQEKAEKAMKAFEDEMEAKYKGDEAFMKEVEKEAEKCEDASEGRDKDN